MNSAIHTGDKYIDGGEGDDEILGSTGDDWIFGGLGNDLIEGGIGAAEFLVNRARIGSRVMQATTILMAEKGMISWSATAAMTFLAVAPAMMTSTAIQMGQQTSLKDKKALIVSFNESRTTCSLM